jgi:anion-transporting  ArsA/GET3 family ATPase
MAAKARRASDAPATLERLFSAKEIVIHCGSGGVGKTTTAAAAAAEAAVHLGGKVLVLTVDPAKRLANALGIEQFGNIEARVPAAAFEAAGVEPRGELWAAMLDTKQSWDDLIRRHAPDAATRDAILANPLYQNLMGRFVQSHDYIAMERLYDLHTSGKYDLIVVDTPPTRHAIDFLEAPGRMADFFSSRLLRWLTAPARSKVVNFASKPFYTVADRILGTQFLQDIAEFFLLFQSMYDGFVERAEAVEKVIHDRRSTFVVVSTLESAPVREAEFFIGELARRDLHLGAVVFNKVLPSWLLERGATTAARALEKRSAEVAEAVGTALGEDVDQVQRVLSEVGTSFLNFQVVAQREAETRAELAATPEIVASVPYFDHDIVDVAGLLQLGDAIWR